MKPTGETWEAVLGKGKKIQWQELWVSLSCKMEYAKEAICIGPNVLTNFSKKQIEIYLSLVDERNNASDWTSFALKSGSTFEPFKKKESGQNLGFI